MRVAIYASSKTDIARCREYAATRQWDVVDIYGDDEKEATALERPGLQALMKAAKERSFDVLLSPSPKEISRNLLDYTKIIQSLDSHNLKVVTLAGDDGSSLVSNILVARAEFEDKLSKKPKA